MRSIARHTIAAGRVFALVFFLASSGFTAILNFCAMEACECCDFRSCGGDTCSLKLIPVAATYIHIGGCNTNTVVGGFAIAQALVEKESKVQSVEVLSLPIRMLVSPSPGNISTWSNYSYSESVSPLSVEKYVLNETFRI